MYRLLVMTPVVNRFRLGAQSVAVITDHPLLQQLLTDGLYTELTALPGTAVEPGDLLVEIFNNHPNAVPLISEPLLPLSGTPLQLRRERELRGWVLGDLLHMEDGLHSLDLNYLEGRARALIDIDAIFATPRLLTHTYALLAIVELLRTRDVYFIHGACAVNPRGGGVLLLGDGGSGKSTTVYLLLRQGWSYVGDDTLLMQRTPSGKVQVVPLLRRFLLHGMLTHRFPGLTLERLQPDGKGMVTPASLGANAARPYAVPDHALLLQPGKKGVSSVAPVRKSTLLAELIRQNQFLFMHSHLAARHLELLTQLCKQCDANKLELAEDVLAAPAKLVQLLDRYERAHAVEHYF